MKNLLLLAALSASTLSYASENSKVYNSFGADYEGTLTLVPSTSEDIYYLNFAGFESKIDGKTLLYKKIKNSINNGYYFKQVGMPNINFRNDNDQTLIYGTVYSYSKVYLENDSVTKVVYVGSPDINKINKVKSLYKEQQLNVISVIAAKKSNKVALEKMNRRCHTNITTSIDWNNFDKHDSRTTPAKLTAYLNALANICSIDMDYLNAVQNIKNIDVTLSKNPNTHHANITGTTLHLQLGKDVANLPETSYQLMSSTL